MNIAELTVELAGALPGTPVHQAPSAAAVVPAVVLAPSSPWVQAEALRGLVERVDVTIVGGQFLHAEQLSVILDLYRQARAALKTLTGVTCGDLGQPVVEQLDADGRTLYLLAATFTITYQLDD